MCRLTMYTFECGCIEYSHEICPYWKKKKPGVRLSEDAECNGNRACPYYNDKEDVWIAEKYSKCEKEERAKEKHAKKVDVRRWLDVVTG